MCKKLIVGIVLFVVFFGFSKSINGQVLKEKKFQQAVKNVIKYYNEKNTGGLGKLIHPRTGCYVLSTP